MPVAVLRHVQECVCVCLRSSHLADRYSSFWAFLPRCATATGLAPKSDTTSTRLAALGFCVTPIRLRLWLHPLAVKAVHRSDHIDAKAWSRIRIAFAILALQVLGARNQSADFPKVLSLPIVVIALAPNLKPLGSEVGCAITVEKEVANRLLLGVTQNPTKPLAWLM